MKKGGRMRTWRTRIKLIHLVYKLNFQGDPHAAEHAH
jgi:hypothetical protein